MNTEQTLQDYLEAHADDYFNDAQGKVWLGEDVPRSSEESGTVHVVENALYLRAEVGMPLTALNLWLVVRPRDTHRWPDPAAD